MQACPTTNALRKQQAALLAQKQYEQAFEQLKRCEKAAQRASREHRQRMEESNARQLAAMRREQRVEREELKACHTGQTLCALQLLVDASLSLSRSAGAL